MTKISILIILKHIVCAKHVHRLFTGNIKHIFVTLTH